MKTPYALPEWVTLNLYLCWAGTFLSVVAFWRSRFEGPDASANSEGWMEISDNVGSGGGENSHI